MNQSALPLIVGAGPVGLGAALLLRQAGIATRIIDMAEKPTAYSKALAVNPRTLELLESTGVTEKMLAIGLRIRGARFQMLGKWSGELSLSSLKHKFPFMLALSQATTERLLHEALEAAGGHVERGTALVTCGNKADDVVEAELKHSPDGIVEEYECPWMLAADGAHSAARKSLGIDFRGSSMAQPWYLADLLLNTSLPEDFAHVFFFPEGGFLFLIRVVDDSGPERSADIPVRSNVSDQLAQSGSNAGARSSLDPQPSTLGSSKLWRIICDRQELLQRIPDSTPAGKPVWTSDFHISHRINEHLKVGNVYFAGDAAHIHSPMGARGMNLGLEDAWVFSRLAQTNQLKQYDALRKKVDADVVHRIEFLSRIVLGESWSARLARAAMMRWFLKVSAFEQKLMAAMTGLDHPLEFETSRQAEQDREKGEQARSKMTQQHAH